MEINEIKEMIGNRKMFVHNCSFCGYPCGYLVRDGKVYYDSGCDCVTYGPNIQPRDDNDLLNFINTNNMDKDEIQKHLR